LRRNFGKDRRACSQHRPSALLLTVPPKGDPKTLAPHGNSLNVLTAAERLASAIPHLHGFAPAGRIVMSAARHGALQSGLRDGALPRPQSRPVASSCDAASPPSVKQDHRSTPVLGLPCPSTIDTPANRATCLNLISENGDWPAGSLLRESCFLPQSDVA